MQALYKQSGESRRAVVYFDLAVNNYYAVIFFAAHALLEHLGAVHRVLVFTQADFVVAILVELFEHLSCAPGIHPVLGTLLGFV